MTDDELIRHFEAGQEPPGGFHHREHVRVAWLYLRREPLAAALERFRSGLRRFAEAQGKPERYHETITTAYMLLIHERWGTAPTWDEFATANPDLLVWSPSILDRYYRPETLASERARREFIAPDGERAMRTEPTQLDVHRPPAAQRHPASDDAIDEPHSGQQNRQPRDNDANPERQHDEERAERHPEQPEPERANLPPEVGFEPGAAGIGALHVVQNDGNDRRPPGQKGADNGRGAKDSGQEAERVQPID